MFAPKDEEPLRKRQRKARSCEKCRSRKVKCDQEQPCGPCLRSRDSLSCRYRDFDRPKADRPEVNTGNSVSGAVPTNVGTSDPGHGLSDSFEPPTHDETVRELQERVRRLEESQVNSRSPRGVRETDRTTTAAGLGLSVDPIIPRLRSTPAKEKLFGQSHWMHVAEKAIGSFDSEVEPPIGRDKAEFTRTFKELRTLRSAVKAHQQPSSDSLISISDLHATFPPRKECEVLVQGYLRTCEKIYRVLHVPTFLDQYAQFWDDPQAVPKAFNVQLALILAIGVTFTSPKDISRELDYLRRQAQQWIYAAQWWLSGPTEKATHNLPALQCFCLLILARQVNGLGTAPSMSPASLLSMAMQMGLHRSSQMFPMLSRFQVESRARLWATVVELYLPSLLDNSIPPLVDLDTVDARDPANIDDTDLTDGHLSEAPLTSSDRTTDTSIQLLLLRSQKLRLRAIQVLSDVRMQTSYETVVDLANQLRSACTEVASFFHSRASYLGPETAFHRKYMDMYLRRYVLLLHRPFMLQAKGDPRFYLSRKTCLESCMIMASYTDDLNLPLAEPDDVCSLMVHGSGHCRGGMGLDVIVTLAFELITQLQEEAGEEAGSGPGRGGPGRQPPSSSGYDPARELARAAREPIVRRLEHIREQLFQIITLGTPSLKRSGILSILLAHIRSLEAGVGSKEALYEAIRECINKCLVLLREYMAAHISASQALEPAGKMPALSDASDVSFENLDLDALIDPLNLFNPSVLDGNYGIFGF